MKACPLRFAFGQSQRGHHGRAAPAARLGRICHRVLDEAVATGALRDDDWRQLVAAMWDTAASDEGHADEPPPAEWPGYQVKRARLLRLAGQLRERLSNLPEHAALLTEVRLE